MRKPSLEEVKKYFENAKVVYCSLSEEEIDITKNISRDIYFEDNTYWVDIEGTEGVNIELWDENNGYSRIVEYKSTKEEKMDERHELIKQLKRGEISIQPSERDEIKDLREVLKETFPNDKTTCSYKFDRFPDLCYSSDHAYSNYWIDSSNEHLLKIPLKDFLKEPLYISLGTKKTKKEWEDFLGYSIEGNENFELEREKFKKGDIVKILSTGTGVSHMLDCTGVSHIGLHPGAVVFIEGISFKGGKASKDDPRYYGKNWNVRGVGLRLATPEEIKIFNNSFLPKIGCQEGEETERHIKYGDVNLSKKCLLQMQKAGIHSIDVKKGDTIYKVYPGDLEKIYKISAKN